jgi:hypothetical protein
MSKKEILDNKTINQDFRIIEVGNSYVRNGIKLFSRNRFIDYSEITNFLKETNCFGSFCTNYRYCDRSNTDGCLIYGDLYFDFDNEQDFEQVRKDALTVIAFLETVFKINENSYSLFYSGNKGIHLTVPAEVLGVEPCMDLNDIYKYIAIIAKNYTPFKTLDTQVYDRKRLFRIPNTIHEKSNLYKIQITYQELQNNNLLDIKQMAQQPRQLNKTKRILVPVAHQRLERFIEDYHREAKQKEADKNKTRKSSINFIPPCVEKILQYGANVGQRNITIACLASLYKSMGETYNNAVSLISEWNSNNVTPTPERELRRTVQSIYSSDKTYGCKTLCLISECSDQCKIYKNKMAKLNGNPKNPEETEKTERQNKLKELGII